MWQGTTTRRIGSTNTNTDKHGSLFFYHNGVAAPESDGVTGLKSFNYLITQDNTAELWGEINKITASDSIMQSMLSMELYEDKLGMGNTSGSPFGLVLVNSVTDSYTDSLMELTLKTLVMNKVPEASGMSLMELLDLPSHMLKTIVESVKEVSRQSSIVASKVKAELEDGK